MNNVFSSKSTKVLCFTAAAGALLALTANIADIVIGMGTEEVARFGSRSAAEWFHIYSVSRFDGLYQLGLFNIIYTLCMAPVYFGLLIKHYETHRLLSIAAFLLFLMGASIYISNNAGIPMMILADKYQSADVSQKVIFAAAGEALLAHGEDFTPGSFAGLFLTGIAAIVISAVMLMGRVFSRRNAIVGIAGFSILSLFTVTATFIPSMYKFSFYFLGMAGGMLALAWFVMTTAGFWRIGRQMAE